MPTDRLGGRIATVDLRTAKASFDVRATLPSLVEQARRWTRATICPMCNGPKTPTSRRCKRCFELSKRLAISGRRRDITVPHNDGLGGRGHQPSAERRAGHPVDQPKLPRWIKASDGSWQREFR